MELLSEVRAKEEAVVVILAEEMEEMVDVKEEMGDVALNKSVVSLILAARSARDARRTSRDVVTCRTASDFHHDIHLHLLAYPCHRLMQPQRFVVKMRRLRLPPDTILDRRRVVGGCEELPCRMRLEAPAEGG